MSPAEALARADEALAEHRDICGCGAGRHVVRLQAEWDRAWLAYVRSLTTGGVR